jgi:hypothetical protein
MPMIQWWKHCCSRCGNVYAQTLAQKPIWLGTGSRRCKKCGTAFSDGSKEWPQLSSAERWSFVIPNGALVCLGSAILFGGLAYTDGENLLDSVLFGGLFLLPYLPVWIKKSIEVARSRRRHALAVQERVAGRTSASA